MPKHMSIRSHVSRRELGGRAEKVPGVRPTSANWADGGAPGTQFLAVELPDGPRCLWPSAGAPMSQKLAWIIVAVILGIDIAGQVLWRRHRPRPQLPVRHALKMGARGGLIGGLVLGGAFFLYRSMAGALGLPAWDSPIVFLGFFVFAVFLGHVSRWIEKSRPWGRDPS